MKLGIMQPYFFPYIGYFSLIKLCDRWVVFDTPQYIERGWVNRNRIIHPTKPEAMYITVPAQCHHQTDSIKDIQITEDRRYIEKILGQLEASYKKRAPYYRQVMELVSACLQEETQSLSRLNVLGLERVCAYLGFPFHCDVFSAMDLHIGPVNAPDEWALEIAKALGADTYINPPGGKAFFSREKYRKANIALEFLEPRFVPYDQKKSLFLAGLSIIDVMMFNHPSQIKNYLCEYELI